MWNKIEACPAVQRVGTQAHSVRIVAMIDHHPHAGGGGSVPEDGDIIKACPGMVL